MSVYFYDQALLQKIQGVFANTKIGTYDSLVGGEGADAATEQLKLPMIAIHRTNWSPDQEMEHYGQKMRGHRFAVINEGTDDEQRFMVREFPVKINYQIEVFSDKRVETDTLAAELYCWLRSNKLLSFTVTRPISWTCMESEVEIEDVSDNSDISSFGERGRRWRTTFEVVVKNARFFLSKEYPIVLTIPVDIEIDLVDPESP